MHCEFYYLKEKASINCQITNCHVQLQTSIALDVAAYEMCVYL